MSNEKKSDLMTIKVNKDKLEDIVDYFIFVYTNYPLGVVESMPSSTRNQIRDSYRYACELKEMINAN